MKWTFISTGLAKFNADYAFIKPLGGMESSVCYLMNSLINLGEEVEFYQQNGESLTINNIQHHNLYKFENLESIKSDICVFFGESKDIVKIKKIIKKTPLIFWIHHSYDQPLILNLKNDEIIKNLTAIIFISNWQKSTFVYNYKLLNIKTNVIGLGITPDFEKMFSDLDEFKSKKERCLGIYSSAPYRGLDILYESSKILREEILINIFSSMNTYSEGDERYLDLFNNIKTSSKFNYLGSVNKNKLAQYFKLTSFLTYPSIFEETFCVTLLDALAAGIEPIITNLGALKEISLGYGRILNLESDNLIKDYANIIDTSIKNKNNNFDLWCSERFSHVKMVNSNYNWKKKAAEWINFAKSL